MKHTAFSPGKAIIIGDHTIVHGGKGYVVPLDKGIEVSLSEGSGQISINDDSSKAVPFIKQQIQWFSENVSEISNQSLDINVTLQIPTSAGIGSSTALTTALFKALLAFNNKTVSLDNLYEYVLGAELASYSVSGIDQSCIVYNQPLVVEKDAAGVLSFSESFTAKELKNIVLVSSGAASESTAEMVAVFTENIKNKPEVYKKMLQTAEQFISKLQESNVSFNLLQEFGDYLIEMGVVGERGQRMISQLKEIGAGAKITAGGGVKTGSGMLLVWHQDLKRLKDFLQSMKWNYFPLVSR